MAGRSWSRKAFRAPRKSYAKKRRQASFKSRRTSKRGRSLRLPRAGIPQSRTCRLVYCTQLTLNGSASGASGVNAFSANGMYDPDVTGTGHQPMGFDQMMTLYNHYTVIGSKIRMRSAPYASGSVAIPPIVGIHLADSPTAISSLQPENIMEIGSKTQQWGVQDNIGPKNQYLTKAFSAKRFFRKQAIVADVNYQGDASSNPAEQAYFICWAAGMGGNDATAITVLVEIEYIAVFTERRAIAQS